MPEIQLTAANVCSYTVSGADENPFFGVEQTTIDTGMVRILTFLFIFEVQEYVINQRNDQVILDFCLDKAYILLINLS